jgi:hypothetical protein
LTAAAVKMENTKVKVIAELLNTERDYANDIEQLLNVFIMPIITQNIINKDEAVSLFANVEVILAVSKRLISSLEKSQDIVSLAFQSVVKNWENAFFEV